MTTPEIQKQALAALADSLAAQVSPTPWHRSLDVAGWHLNIQRHRCDDAVLQHYGDLLRANDFEQKREALFSGAPLNVSEQRAVLHTALRRPLSSPLMVAGTNVMDAIRATQERMAAIVASLDQGALLGSSGEPITDVINIGIGGSDLGPAMVYDALRPYTTPSRRCHFVANIDPGHLRDRLSQLDPTRTVVVIVSKSFTTEETLANAEAVKAWMLAGGVSLAAFSRQCFAVSAAVDKARDFGIAAANVLPMWDWVGGRFSLWSAVSLALVMCLGMTHYHALLAGAAELDAHFQQAPLSENAPVLMAVLGAWYGEYWQASTQAILPYSQYLAKLPDYLQQLHMESLGKSVDCAGNAVSGTTGRIIWGGVGTNTQHSFHQLFMQGTYQVPVDFILPLKDYSGQANTALSAHCLAQAEVLWRGVSHTEQGEEVASHQRIAGGKPSTMLLCEQLTPATLGSLIALYEHKVFVQAVLWGINAFDQWGVERGKVMAKSIRVAMAQPAAQFQGDAVSMALLATIERGVTS